MTQPAQMANQDAKDKPAALPDIPPEYKGIKTEMCPTLYVVCSWCGRRIYGETVQELVRQCPHCMAP